MGNGEPKPLRGVCGLFCAAKSPLAVSVVCAALPRTRGRLNTFLTQQHQMRYFLIKKFCRRGYCGKLLDYGKVCGSCRVLHTFTTALTQLYHNAYGKAPFHFSFFSNFCLRLYVNRSTQHSESFTTGIMEKLCKSYGEAIQNPCLS